jgi:hypothetical protein
MDEFKQFQYLDSCDGNRSNLLRLASEELLKEIGVDIQKFL